MKAVLIAAAKFAKEYVFVPNEKMRAQLYHVFKSGWNAGIRESEEVQDLLKALELIRSPTMDPKWPAYGAISIANKALAAYKKSIE